MRKNREDQDENQREDIVYNQGDPNKPSRNEKLKGEMKLEKKSKKKKKQKQTPIKIERFFLLVASNRLIETTAVNPAQRITHMIWTRTSAPNTITKFICCSFVKRCWKSTERTDSRCEDEEEGMEKKRREHQGEEHKGPKTNFVFFCFQSRIEEEWGKNSNSQ